MLFPVSIHSSPVSALKICSKLFPKISVLIVVFWFFFCILFAALKTYFVNLFWTKGGVYLREISYLLIKCFKTC